MYDPQKDKAVQFTNEPGFSLKDVYKISKSIKGSAAPENLEIYTNEDYDKLEGVDFRTLRRHNKPVKSELVQDETISELEDLEDSSDEPISKIKHFKQEAKVQMTDMAV